MTTMKETIQDLARQNRLAKTKSEKEAISKNMESLHEKEPKAFTEALESLIKSTSERVDELTMA